MRHYSVDISVNLRSKDDKRHTIFHSISGTWWEFSPHYRYMHWGQGNYQPQIANCLLYGVLAYMCHSCCGGLVNIPVKRAKAIILAQAQNQWQKHAYCLILFYRIYTRLHLIGKPYDFNVVASLMVLAQTVRPLWLLQGERTLILVCPWHITSDINCLSPI